MSDEFLELIKAAKADADHVDLLVDTNVMMEIDSIGDLIQLGDRLGSEEALEASPEARYRQLRSRYSILFAWWLSQTGTVVGTLGNEVVDQLEGKLAPDTDDAAYAFTTGIVHVIRPFVLKGMKTGALLHVNHEATKDDADTELLNVAIKEKLPIVTNEGLTQRGLTENKDKDTRNLRGRCRDAGVAVYTPEEFLSFKGVDVNAEAERFCSAVRKGIDEAKAQGVLMSSAGGREVMSYLNGVYRWIMLDEVDPAYAARRDARAKAALTLRQEKIAQRQAARAARRAQAKVKRSGKE
ncbi:MAG: hypothetical protein AB7T06_26215 [Kofleriaceae bacterium]